MNIQPFDPTSDNFIHVYITAFEAHPWHEQYRCHACGQQYATVANLVNGGSLPCTCLQTRKNLKVIEGERCGCGEPLEQILRPFYTPQSVMADAIKDMKRPGYIGLQVVDGARFSGFFWGYHHPPATENVSLTKMTESLSRRGIDVSQLFYHSEAAIDKRLQGHGLGRRMLREMALLASAQFRYISFRTVNPAMRHVYEKVFREVVDLGHDPNPRKDQLWYLVSLRDMRGE